MTEGQYYNDIVKKMQSLNLYRDEYEHAIKGLSRALSDQEKTLTLFDKSGGQIMIKHTNKAGATNAVKNPFYLALETLRKDVLDYSRELGLTPAALKRINESAVKQKKTSSLANALKELSG